jgi:hypothetical protein
MLDRGHTLDAIARRMGTAPLNIRKSFRAQGMELDREPDADIRARWERMLPAIKAAFVREILRDQA